MQKTTKKLSLCFLIVSLVWLPIQVSFASSFMSSETMSEMSSVPTQDLVDKVSELSDSHPKHCDMQQNGSDCCNENGACNQIDHECHHCISFVAMAQNIQHKFIFSGYSFQNTYSQRLTGMTTINNYRPPRYI